MTHYPLEQITGLVLAGGRGVRVGGVDKGLLDFNGEPIAKRVIVRLKKQTQLILVSANRHRSDYEAFGVPVVQDRIPDYQGPLAGIEAALSVCPSPYLLIAPCDAPFISLDLGMQLYQCMEASGTQVVYASSQTQEGRWDAEPMFALIRTQSLSHLRAYLESGERKVLSWYQSVSYATVCINDSRCFANANTPDDFKDMAQWATQEPL